MAGVRPLVEMLRKRTLLMPNKDLRFKVTYCTVTHPYDVKWKVLNRGEVAVRRNNIRGQIIGSSQPVVRNERTSSAASTSSSASS